MISSADSSCKPIQMLKVPTEVTVHPKAKVFGLQRNVSRNEKREKTEQKQKMNTSARQKLDIFIDNNKLSMFDKNSSMSQRSHEESYHCGYSSQKLSGLLLDSKDAGQKKAKVRIVESIKVKQTKIEAKKP